MSLSQNKFQFRVGFLKCASVAFLVLPIILFICFWVKPWIALFVFLTLGFALYNSIRIFLNDPKIISIQYWQLLLILFFAFVWVSHCGAGGFGIQLHDLSKIYAIVHDVASKSKPVSYQINNQTQYLSSYLGYHITAPILFGFLGWKSIMIALFILTYIGVLISLFWFFLLIDSFSIFALLFFVFIGGFDFAGHIFQFGIKDGLNNIINDPFGNFIFWDNSLDKKFQLIYHGNTNSLFWSPQHAISCWITSGFFFYQAIKEKNIFQSPIYLFSLVFWSPMMLIGLFPYFIMHVNFRKISTFLKFENLSIIPAFLVLFLFTNAVPVKELDKGFLFYTANSKLGLIKEIFSYLWFCVFEFGIWLGIAYFLLKKSDLKKLIIPIAIILMLIPLYKLGKYNDWCQRVSLPSLLLVWVIVYKGVLQANSKIIKAFILILIVLSSIDSYNFLGKSIQINGLVSSQNLIPESAVLDWPNTSIKYGWPLEQSLAPKESFFFKYLAKD